jgi:hypothetical protein
VTNPDHRIRFHIHRKGFFLPLAAFAFWAERPALPDLLPDLDALGSKAINSTI